MFGDRDDPFFILASANDPIPVKDGFVVLDGGTCVLRSRIESVQRYSSGTPDGGREHGLLVTMMSGTRHAIEGDNPADFIRDRL